MAASSNCFPIGRMRRFPSMPIIHRGITLPQRSEHLSILFLMQCTDRQPNAVSMWSTPITGMSLWFSDAPPFYALAFIMEALVRSLHCRSQQPTDLTRRYRFWPFPLLDTPVAVAGGRFDTPNRITERPFCEELHGHFWRRPFGLSDSKDSALQ